MRLNKILAAVAAVAAVSSSYAGTINHVSAGPAPLLTAIMNVGERSGQEYIVSTDDPMGTFAAFCLNPNLSYFAPGPDSYTKATFTAAKADALSMLFTGAGWQSWNYANDAIDQGFEQHGLALAVWDIMNDDGNLLTGAFRVLGGQDGAGGASLAFVAAAQLSGNTSLAGNLIKLDLTDPKLQDMVIAVPEPSTYAMLLAGLAGVGFVARRRQQRG